MNKKIISILILTILFFLTSLFAGLIFAKVFNSNHDDFLLKNLHQRIFYLEKEISLLKSQSSEKSQLIPAEIEIKNLREDFRNFRRSRIGDIHVFVDSFHLS